jgi:hypothetical protein
VADIDLVVGDVAGDNEFSDAVGENEPCKGPPVTRSDAPVRCDGGCTPDRRKDFLPHGGLHHTASLFAFAMVIW